MATRSLCNTRILRRQIEANAGFEPKSKDIEKGDLIFLPDGEAEWGHKPRPAASDTILPEDGKAPVISCEVQWTDLRIDVRTNLIDKLLAAMQTVLNTGVGVMSNENTVIQAVQQIAASLRTLVEGSQREFTQPWLIRFTSDLSSPYVFAKHNQTCTTFVSQIGVMGSTWDMHVWASAEVRLDSVLIDQLTLTADKNLGQTQERENAQKCAPVALQGTQHTLSINNRLKLEFVGFKQTIEKLIAQLTEIIRAVSTGGITAARVWQMLKDIASADDPVAEAERTAERLRQELENGLKSALQSLIDILTEFRGHVIVNVSAIQLLAIDEPTFIAIDDRANGVVSDLPASPDSPPAAEPPTEELPPTPPMDGLEDGASLPVPARPTGLLPATRPLRVTFTVPEGGLSEAMVVHFDPIFQNDSIIALPRAVHRRLVGAKPGETS